MRQHAAFLRQQCATERAHRLAGSDVFLVHRMRFGEQFLPHLAHGKVCCTQCRKYALHPVDGPEKIHRSRSRSRQPRANPLELWRKFLRGRGLGLQSTQSHAVSR